MGCSFYFKGTVPEPDVQEKVIAFVQQYYTDVELIIRPEPDTVYRTRFVTPEEETEDDYPFNFFGVVPLGDRYSLRPHGQFIFDRTAGGELVRFLKLPYECEEGEDAPERSTEECVVAIARGGYNRLPLGIGFSLLLHIIKLRWCPDLEMDDGYFVCEKTGAQIWEYGLAQKLSDENLDYNICRALFFDELDRREPPKKRDHIESGPRLRIVDTVATDIAIEDLELSIRTSNCLKAMKLKTVGDLLECTEKDLLAIRNFGRKSLWELTDLLAGYGLHLKKE